MRPSAIDLQLRATADKAIINIRPLDDFHVFRTSSHFWTSLMAVDTAFS
jgi:hypothetical protein